VSAAPEIEIPRVYGVIYAEDFDDVTDADAVPQADSAIAPVDEGPHITVDDVLHAEQRGRAEGFDAGVEHALNSREVAASERQTALLEELCTGLVGAQERCAETVRAQAGVLADEIIEAIGTLLPTLYARFGEVEMMAVTDVILSSLTRHVRVQMRVSAEASAMMMQYGSKHFPGRDLAIVSDDSMAAGDIRLDWAEGHAQRDHRDICDAVCAALTTAHAAWNKRQNHDA